MQRKPAVAGQFYPGEESELRQLVEGLLVGTDEQEAALGIVSPHAGYIYSGAIAGRTFARVKVPRRVIILGPNHHAFSHPAALFPPGSWQTPLGEVPIDEQLTAQLLRESPLLVTDPLTHRYEHALEVQLPFIQVRNPQASIVPICLGFSSLEKLLAIGQALARAIAASPEPVLMVASNDMSHFETGEVGRKKDDQALERVLALDPEGLWQTVRNHRISMCGVVPVTVMLAAARQLGASRATLVGYSNSGDVTGDQSQVVGYAGVVVR
ncbi:MAG: AmmeMemoRadiSam system protein B [Desulfuromonadales bacterium]|nr:AmmeMemoRadiSam system protein B [Desulfuromonadales bacterium]